MTTRPAAAAAARRLLLWRVLRRRGRLRHAGRGHRRDPDGPRLHAAGRVGPVAHRQHGAGRVWRARHADHRAAAVTGLDLLELSAMVGRQLPFFSVIVPFWLICGVRRLRGDARRSGRRSSSPACRSRCRSSWCRTITGRGWWTSSRRSCRWARWRCSCAVWQPTRSWTFVARGRDRATRRAG